MWRELLAHPLGLQVPQGLRVVGLQQGAQQEAMTSFSWQGKAGQPRSVLASRMCYCVAPCLRPFRSSTLGFLSPEPGSAPGLHVRPAPFVKPNGHSPPC